MPARTLPSVIASREVPGVAGCSSAHNLAWNDDGQCLIVSRQAVTVATPYLTTDQAPPAMPLSYKVLSKDDKDDEDDDDEMELERDGAAYASRALARPASGEVKWWIMGVVEKGKGKEDDYGWSEVGDEVTNVVTERERHIRAAVWSPSGLSRLGGCLLAVMSSTFQVSIYAPGDDTLSSEYEEIADITMETMRLLEPGMVSNGEPSLQGMLRMRAMSMAWSPRVAVPSMIGVDGSLLALATRAGGIDFWSYGVQGFSRVAQVVLPSPWGSQLAWSDWSTEKKTTSMSMASARLAVALTDGSVWVIPVTRSTDGATWDTTVGEAARAGPADRRGVTALEWMTDDLLVWAKAGSVHLFSSTTGTLKTVRLDRVGNWAGCNALGACIGLHLSSPTTLVVVLDSLTYHVVTDILSSPTQQPIESLRATLSARDVFLDCARRRRRKFQAASDKDLTANTTGWAALDATGDIVTWTAEPLARHNLDNATHINRLVDFVTVDLKLTDDDSSIPRLSTLLSNPQSRTKVQTRLTTVLGQSPVRQLAPHLLRMIARGESEYAEVVYGLVSKLPPMPSIPNVSPNADWKKPLMQGWWGDSAVDALRLRWVLARWGQVAFSSMQSEFTTLANKYEELIVRTTAQIGLRWFSAARVDAPSPGELQFGANLMRASGALNDDHSAGILGDIETAESTPCPACGAPIQSTSGCTNGHEWDRCSVTHLLITTPDYRVCTVCPAISLLPRSIAGSAESDAGDELIQVALEAAVACTCCGGRWTRSLTSYNE